MKICGTSMVEDDVCFASTAMAVILYDDLESLLAANHLVDRIPFKAGESVEWIVNSWQFDMLKLGSRLEAYRALEEVPDAAMILVTLSKPEAWCRLPADWLECWAACRRVRDAKLIIMPFGRARAGVENAQLVGRLGRWAEHCNLSFSIYGSAPSAQRAEAQSGGPRVKAHCHEEKTLFKTMPGRQTRWI